MPVPRSSSARFLLNADGENPKIIQEFLCQARIHVTVDTYVQAVVEEKGSNYDIASARRDH